MTALQLPSRETTVYWYLGTDDCLARGGLGTTDVGQAIGFRARTRSYAPAGIGGEVICTNVYLSMQRANTADLSLTVTPIVDGVEKDAIALVLEATDEPVREVHELGLAQLYPSAADPQIAVALRGCWFQLEVRASDAGAAGRLVIEGVELEFETVTEGKQASNASA